MCGSHLGAGYGCFVRFYVLLIGGRRLAAFAVNKFWLLFLSLPVFMFFIFYISMNTEPPPLLPPPLDSDSAVYRAERCSEPPSVITIITGLYCNYSNYVTVLFFHALSANVTVITAITIPYCNYGTYDTCEPQPCLYMTATNH